MIEMVTSTASAWELMAFVSAMAALVASAVGVGLPTWDLMVARNESSSTAERIGREALRLAVFMAVVSIAFVFHTSVLILQPPVSIERPVTFGGRVYGVVVAIYGGLLCFHVAVGLLARRHDFNAALAAEQRQRAEAQIDANAHLSDSARGGRKESA